MKYIQAKYSGSDRMYTFQTAIDGIIPFTKGLVRDKNGFSLVTLGHYVSKPHFPCKNVLLGQAMMEELDEEVSNTGVLPPEEYEERIEDSIGRL